MIGLSPAFAQNAGTAGTAKVAGFRSDFLSDFQDASKKIVSLAEAIPAEKYAWRPAEGVMSVAEVLGHVAGSSFYYAERAGGQKPPADVDLRGLEKLQDKEKVVQALRRSSEFAEQAIQGLEDQRLDQTVNVYGNETRSVRGVLMGLSAHMHEHLGQVIAYARMNGVAPPWSK